MIIPDKDFGAPLSILVKKYCNKTKNSKFIYPDAWGDIVLRNEAWLHINNFIKCITRNCFEPDILDEILRQQEKICKFEKYRLCNTTMERFWEEVINKSKIYVKEMM